MFNSGVFNFYSLIFEAHIFIFLFQFFRKDKPEIAHQSTGDQRKACKKLGLQSGQKIL
jgi:hypothetical protein